MSPTTFYLFQYRPIWADQPGNHKQIESLVREAKPEPNSILVFPEMCTTGFLVAEQEKSRFATGEPFGTDKDFFEQLAKQYQCACLSGTFKTGADKNTNQALFTTPEGNTHTVSKIHPFPLGGEAETFQGGEEVAVWPWQDLQINTSICFDLRFPELYQIAADKGADVLAVIANWPGSRQNHWNTLLAARAIETQSWVVAVNICGEANGISYLGGSGVVNPKGEWVAQLKDFPETLKSEIDPNFNRNWRKKFPVRNARKSLDFYSKLLK